MQQKRLISAPPLPTLQIQDLQRATVLLFLLLSGILGGCASHRAFPEEKALLPEQGVEKYWLLNQVSSFQNHQTQHDCILLTQSPSAEGTATSLFVSRWDSRDSSYHYGIQISTQAASSKPGRWPMAIHVAADSLGAGWRWFWDRHSIWVEGSLIQAYDQDYHMHGHFYPCKPYTISTHTTTPSILEIASFNTTWESTAGGRNLYAEANLAVFVQASSLIQADQPQAVCWVKLGLGKGDYLSLLLKMTPQGAFQILAQRYEGDHLDWENVDLKVTPSETPPWKSLASKKNYPLQWTLSTGSRSLRIQPRIQNQEIQAGKKSFWMGAIEAIDTATGEHIGNGNMYIFTH
jgi:hypothetical protein